MTTRETTKARQSGNKETGRKDRFDKEQLLDVLKRAEPGEKIEFEGVSLKEMDSVIKELSEVKKVRPRDDFNMGDHVWCSTNWWGLRIEFDHVAVQAQDRAFTLENLMMVGVPIFAALIVRGAMNMIVAQDAGNGVVAFVTWAGVHWYLPR